MAKSHVPDQATMPSLRNPQDSHTSCVLTTWEKLAARLKEESTQVAINGEELSLADLVAVSRHFCSVKIEAGVLHRLEQSLDALHQQLKDGQVIYGVNTGFGASANTRTSHHTELQLALFRALTFGPQITETEYGSTGGFHGVHEKLAKGLLNEEPVSATSMPELWVRATMLVRLNSLISGASAVRPVVVERMVDLLEHHISPKVPIYGSISASGDLSPLSYIGGALLGDPGIKVTMRDATDGQCETISAREALARRNLEPIRAGPKEMLAIVNGTAVSSAVAALALYDAHGLAMLSQMLTAMTTEALEGSTQSFDPFFGSVRPHPGQIESAQNIMKFIEGSKLTWSSQPRVAGRLRQDRYSIRTASQWIGPALEDLMLADQQIQIELNSVTDNPLLDVSGAATRTLHGGNFQARSITSAMEKTRQSMQSLGRMMFAQCNELTDASKNNGLPPSLAIDEPSVSFMMKGIELMTAALASELGFLANPVGTHVQTAESGNQSLNSIALISARYTHSANHIMSMMAAGHLISVCQALDIRAMNELFLIENEQVLRNAVRGLDVSHDGSSLWLVECIECQLGDDKATELGPAERLLDLLKDRFRQEFDATTAYDCDDRFKEISSRLQPLLVSALSPNNLCKVAPVMLQWSERLADQLCTTYRHVRDRYLESGDATPFLGLGSGKMYRFVRQTLRVPLLHTGIFSRTSLNGSMAQGDVDEKYRDDDHCEGPPLLGTYVTKIYHSIRTGILYDGLFGILKESQPHTHSHV